MDSPKLIETRKKQAGFLKEVRGERGVYIFFTDVFLTQDDPRGQLKKIQKEKKGPLNPT